MIYTVGHKKSYEQGFKEYKDEPLAFRKLGKKSMWNGKPYAGGSCFKTKESACEYLDANMLNTYSVYGLDADWETDTEWDGESEYRNLLRDATLLKID